jgi:threonine/homoserine/homoserine lactone efflux protein
VGVTNPKMIVFLAVALPQFVDPAAGRVTLQMLMLGLLVLVIALGSDAIWALAAGTARDWFARSPRRVELVRGTGGVSMIGVGAGLALTGNQH